MSVYMAQPFVFERIYGPRVEKLIWSMKRCRIKAVVVFDGLSKALVDVVKIPVAAAITVPPTSGWAEFGQSVHRELQA
jgi:hypothetical protein